MPGATLKASILYRRLVQRRANFSILLLHVRFAGKNPNAKFTFLQGARRKQLQFLTFKQSTMWKVHFTALTFIRRGARIL